MLKKSFDQVLSKSKNKEIIVVGAGTYGKELAGALIDNDCDVKCFFDNDILFFERR